MTSAFRRAAASPSKTLLLTTVAFVAMVLVHSWDARRWGAPAVTGAVAAGLLVTAVICRSRPRARLSLSIAAAIFAGAARFDAAIPMNSSSNEPPRTLAPYQGRLAQEPKVTLKGATVMMDRVFVFMDDGAAGSAGQRKPIDGSFALTVSLPPRAQIGDTLAWHCQVFPPTANVGAVASSRSVAGEPWRCISRSPPLVVARGNTDFVMNVLARLKNGIRDVTRALIPEPDASFMLGLLIGDTGGVSKEIVADFRSTGTSHVLAVSGYNVSLVANFAYAFFAFCLIRRRSASVAVAAFLTFFVALSGAGASVVRAALMGGTSVVAALVQRRNAGWIALLLAATLMLLQDPLVIITDVGFRLSFAAVIGMRAFGKPFAHLFRWLPETFGVRSACAETLSATVATLPIVMHDFGTLPVAALPVNMLVVPLVPFATAVGATALLFGAAWMPLGMPLALAATVSTKAMRWFAATGAVLAPAAQVQATASESLVMTAFLVLLWFGLSRWELSKKSAETKPRLTLNKHEA